MNRKKYLIGLILVIIVTFGCESHAFQEGFKTLTAEEAKIELSKDENIVLLDVRSEEEFEEKHIEGSILIPIYVLEEKVNMEIPDKNTRVFVYCKSGKRSTEASEILVNLGYKNVYNIEGLDYWEN